MQISGVHGSQQTAAGVNKKESSDPISGFFVIGLSFCFVKPKLTAF